MFNFFFDITLFEIFWLVLYIVADSLIVLILYWIEYHTYLLIVINQSWLCQPLMNQTLSNIQEIINVKDFKKLKKVVYIAYMNGKKYFKNKFSIDNVSKRIFFLISNN